MTRLPLALRIGGFGRLGYIRAGRRCVAWEWYRLGVPGLAWEVARSDAWRYGVWPKWKYLSVMLAWRKIGVWGWFCSLFGNTRVYAEATGALFVPPKREVQGMLQPSVPDGAGCGSKE